MALILDYGKKNIIDIYLRNEAQNANLYLGLFTSPSSENPATTLSNIVEPLGGGYARIPLAPGDWSNVNVTYAAQPQKSFPISGGSWEGVRGYFICDIVSGIGGTLIGLEFFSDGPYDITYPGGIHVTPKIEFY